MSLSRRGFLFSLSAVAATTSLKSQAGPIKYSPTFPFPDSKLPVLDMEKRLNSLCFGSCNRQDRVQQSWDAICNLNPDLFMWLGDNVYNDTTDMQVMAEKYNVQLNHPEYQRVLKQMPVIGTWDDHDYGDNDAGREYPMREESRIQCLKFLNEPRNSPRWDRAGVYTSYTFGEAGHGKVKIILFDLRYNRMHRRDTNAHLMAQDQWDWFENEIAGSDADFHLLVSSISVLSVPRPYTEDWEKFPLSYNKMFNLLDRHNPKGVLFLAGDKHFGCYSSRPAGPRGQRYFEMMSSGINRTVPGFYKPVVHRVYGGWKSFPEINFGHIRFDWNRENPAMICDIRGRLGQLALRRIFERDPNTGLLLEMPQKDLPTIAQEEEFLAKNRLSESLQGRAL